MAKYIKILEEIDAFFLGIDKDFPKWWRKARDSGKIKMHQSRTGAVWYTIQTAKGLEKAVSGQDYIIRNEKGEIYPLSREVFEAMYEKII